MNYPSVVKYIKSFIPAGEKKWNRNCGLDKFRYFMELLGNPQNNLKFIHIGGTSGKGSTAVILASILTSSGYKTGLHVSPDIITIRERAQIDGNLISKEDFVSIFEFISSCFTRVEEKFGSPPSYYEILLAIAFVYFYRQKCDVVVLEVGLGGKLDATNIIKSQNQIITNIGLDHTKILGSTKALILQDKQEIIKPGSTVVTGVTEASLISILAEKILNTKSKLLLLGRDFQIENVRSIKNKEGIVTGSIFDYCHKSNVIKDITMNLPGSFQTTNSALAITMALNTNFAKVSPATIRKGVFESKIPGRFQIFSALPFGIVDGAHNPDKIKALVDSIKTYYPGQKFITIFRYKKRDDICQSLSLVSEISHEIIITGSKKAGDMGWDKTYEASDYQDVSLYKANCELKLSKAYELALEKSGLYGNCGILVTGSLYMIHEFLNTVKTRNILKLKC